MTDFVDIFRQHSEMHDRPLFYGSRGYQNFELQQQNMTEGQHFTILFPASIVPVIESGRWGEYRVITQVFIGRKFEVLQPSVSSISETEQQKYDARLKEMQTLLDDYLNEVLVCSCHFTPVSIRYFYELNAYSSSVDLCGADITFTMQ